MDLGGDWYHLSKYFHICWFREENPTILTKRHTYWCPIWLNFLNWTGQGGTTLSDLPPKAQIDPKKCVLTSVCTSNIKWKIPTVQSRQYCNIGWWNHLIILLMLNICRILCQPNTGNWWQTSPSLVLIPPLLNMYCVPTLTVCSFLSCGNRLR